MKTQATLFEIEIDERLLLPKQFVGSQLSNGGLTKHAPRRWTVQEINWLEKLQAMNLTVEQIAQCLYRDKVQVAIKLKRLQKKDGETYNEKHRRDKYETNQRFLEIVQPKSVLDLFAGASSFYLNKVEQLTTNDANKTFETTFNEKAERLVCKLYFENKRFDLIDIDPFGSAFDCFDLCVKMAKRAIIVTFGELGHKRFNRLDFVSSHYGINSLEDFTLERLSEHVVTIGKRNKKKLTPIFVRNWRNIGRVYYQIEQTSTSTSTSTHFTT